MNLFIYIFTYNVLLAPSLIAWLSESKIVGSYNYYKLGETSNSIQQVDAQKDTLDMADGDGERPAGPKTLKNNDDAPIIYMMKGPGDEGAIIYDSGNDYFDGANKQTEPFNEDDDLRVIPLKEQEKEYNLMKKMNDVNIEMIEEHSRAGN